MERSKRSLNDVEWKMRMTMEWMKTQTWATVLRASNREDSQRWNMSMMIGWRRLKLEPAWAGQCACIYQERQSKDNDESSMHEDSCIGINHAHMFPKCFKSLHTLLGFALYFLSSILIIVAVITHSILTCTRIPCRDSHCVHGSFEVLSLHPPSVAADRRQLQTIQLQQNREH